jgi:hypothetical protein
MLSHRFRVEPAQSAVGRDQPGGTARRRIEMIFEIQIGPAEIVDR